ncbi:MAG: DMT family transporter [Schleiferiaceae bacterium]
MKENKSQLAWAIFVVLALIWGSSFILMKRGLVSFSPYQVGALRVGFAWLFTLMIGFKHLVKFNKKNFVPFLIVGWLGNGLPYLLFPLAVTKLDTSVVGIINSLVPLFTLIVAVVLYRTPVKKLQILGLFLGLGGAIFLINPSGVGAEISSHLMYAGFAIAATIMYALSITTIKNKLAEYNSMTITLMSLMTTGPFLLIGALATGSIDVLQNDPQGFKSLAYISVLGIVGSSIAVVLFNRLIKLSSSLFASSVTYAIPIVAILWGWIDGENIGWNHLIGGTAILIGVWLVNKKPREKNL